MVETDKYIEFSDGNFVTEKETGEVQIKMCDNNGKPSIATFYNVLFAPDLCDWLFSIIVFINLRHICLFHKGICKVSCSDNEQNTVTLPHSTQ